MLLRICWPALLAASCLVVHSDDWPQWLGPRRDGVWRETGIVRSFPPGGPKIRWRTPIGSGYASPAIANGRVYVTDRKLSEGTKNPSNPFDRGSIPGIERVLCLNEQDGKLIWTHEYDCPYTVSYAAGPRVTPLVDDGKLFTLGAEGNLFCFDASNGKIIWSRDFKKDFGVAPPLWGFPPHPFVDGDRLICLVGGTNSVAVAFNKNTGKEIWRALTAKEPGYCPPTILEFHGKRQLIIWHPESVNALDPVTGALGWSFPWTIQSGLSVPTPRKSGDLLFLTAFYNGSLMLRVTNNSPRVVWRSNKVSEKDTDALHSIIPTPVIDDDCIYGVCSYGQLRCLKKLTGERVWETFAATTGDKEARWANAFLVKHEGRYFIFSEKGDLIIANLTPAGYHEISRAHLLEPTNHDPGREVVWSHPSFANKNVYARNDLEIICASLSDDGK